MRSKSSARASGRLAIARSAHYRPAGTSPFRPGDVSAVFDLLHFSVFEILAAQTVVNRLALRVEPLAGPRRGPAQRVRRDQWKRDRRIRIAHHAIRQIRRIDL